MKICRNFDYYLTSPKVISTAPRTQSTRSYGSLNVSPAPDRAAKGPRVLHSTRDVANCSRRPDVGAQQVVSALQATSEKGSVVSDAVSGLPMTRTDPILFGTPYFRETFGSSFLAVSTPLITRVDL